MASLFNHPGFLRDNASKDRGRVYPVELFFDLVFVFAITQLSHSLLQNLTLPGLVNATLLFLAVWWVWMYTTWSTNWLDPERLPVRIALFVMMLAGLIMSISIPTAFGAGGLAFAAAYAFMQVGRTAFVIYAIGSASPTHRRNFGRILTWLATAGLLWIAGGLTEGNTRLAFWILALSLDYIAPFARFWVPVAGASQTTDWDVDGHHIAERCSLFVLIALGESLIITGTTFEKLTVTAATVAALTSAVLSTVAMWWIYFAIGAERGTHHIAHSADPGRIARDGYTYLHIIIVAGVIVSAVGDELVLAHPGGHVELKYLLVIVGAPILFLIGNGLFKRLSAGNFPLSHLVGFGVLAAIGIAEGLTHLFTPLALSIATSLALVVVAAWEWRSLRGSRPEHTIG
ncbi:low temperature requirement protein A [Phreatobacter aquaticus]|uniref:Low temperature requirement protein A n=1 Tax=Phreatobacter aquaticus TaxID=2570229 RepID=A0A4D7QFY7_9HYPH|nr:low temperature requirement protein A [Phreatobacter aquaticus]QCK84327.1 low temperature requirement protein A [Phreatobacter aquaticus]